MKEFHIPHHDTEKPLPASVFIKVLGHLALHAYNHLPVIHPPRPAPLFEVVEREMANQPQPLHPDISIISANVFETVTQRGVLPPKPLSLPDKLTRSIRMIQFTDRLMGLGHDFINYDSIKTLKDRFVEDGETQAHPLGAEQQLNVALDLTGNNITPALTLLWLSARHYARWLDTVSITNLPPLAQAEILTEIKEYRSAILACKTADSKNFQDTAGDNYFLWTHARARVMFGSEKGTINNLGKLVFKHGTDINSHRIIKQSIPSDHRKAAAIGNAIGDAILNAIQPR